VNTRSIKFRLIAWYAGWLGVLFLIFGIVVYQGLDYYLKRALQDALEMRTRQVARLVKGWDLDREALRKEIQTRFAPEVNNRFTRLTIDGEVRYTSGAPADGSFDPAAVPPALESGKANFEARRLPDGSALLIAVLPVHDGLRHFVIEEGSSNAKIKATLHAWAVALVGGLILLVLLAALGGYIIVQRALSPVDRIIEAAENISSRNLSERLPVPQSGDELERLSLALNNMIRRLDESFRYTQRFLADASHELRTPLTILQAELEGMLDRMHAKSEERELVGSALEEVERLRNIVEGLFALSRLDAGEALNKSERFDLGELVTSTADQMSLLAEDKGITIACEAPEKLLVQGDRARLKQVTVNLLDNAIKYTPEGGEIKVRVITRERKAVLEVTDTGIGIPTEALPYVFDRFYRVDKARSRQLGGAGLGLSIVKSICTAHSGRVEVQSREGTGSQFIVELPLGNGEATSP
jgi:heavy metal sensor kinase